VSRIVVTDNRSTNRFAPRPQDDVKKDWKPNAPILYSHVCEAFEHIDGISARLEIQQTMTTLFRKIIRTNPEDLINTVYLACNDVAPSYECVELGVGDSFLIKAVTETAGSNSNTIKAKYKEVRRSEGR